MTNFLFSLFDPIKDHVNVKESNKPTWHPSIALMHQNSLLGVTHYFLLTEHEHLLAAKAIIRYIQEAHAATVFRIQNTTKETRGKSFIQKHFKDPLKITIVDISYKNIWNLNDCFQDITRELNNKLTRELKDRKIIEADTQLFVNATTGTTQQRTALICWLLQKVHARFSTPDSRPPNKQVNGSRPNGQPPRGFLLFPSEDTEHPAPIGQIHRINVNNNQNTFGFLCMGVDTQHPEYCSILNRIETLIIRAPQDPILLTGPTGVGKSYLAHLIIKYLKCLYPNRYTDENCRLQNIVELTPSLIESELFGHVKGAFTGAISDHMGLFEQTKNGILFLDEIGELSLDLQAKFLTVLDNGNIRRVGDDKIISGCRPRLIFGTNRNLLNEVKAGRFRHDLYERIAMWHFEIPSLSERTADFEKLLQRELAYYRDETNIDCHFSKDAKFRFLSYAKEAPWPGNFREFRSMVRHLAVFAEKGNTISLESVEQEILAHQSIPSESTTVPNADTLNCTCEYDLTDLAQIAIAIDICKQSKTAKEAGEKLFVATRKHNPATFNGGTYLKRLFKKIGLNVKFIAGQPRFSPILE